MANGPFYRGGNSLKPRPCDYRVDKATGLLFANRGVSVSDRPDGLEHFGGAYLVTQIPAELRIVQVGHNAHHFEIVPVQPMTLDDYEKALDQVVLTAV